MALPKMVGLDVTPLTASSRTRRPNPPLVIKLRRRKSSQMLWPASWSRCSGFIAPPRSELLGQLPGEHPTELAGKLGMALVVAVEALLPLRPSGPAPALVGAP